MPKVLVPGEYAQNESWLELALSPMKKGLENIFKGLFYIDTEESLHQTLNLSV